MCNMDIIWCGLGRSSVGNTADLGTLHRPTHSHTHYPLSMGPTCFLLLAYNRQWIRGSVDQDQWIRTSGGR